VHSAKDLFCVAYYKLQTVSYYKLTSNFILQTSTNFVSEVYGMEREEGGGGGLDLLDWIGIERVSEWLREQRERERAERDTSFDANYLLCSCLLIIT